MSFLYEINVNTTPKAIVLGANTEARQVKKLLLKDSIFSFYPYAELELFDSNSEILNNIFFVEGMPFDIKFGTPEIKGDKNQIISGGYLEGKWVWSENVISNGKVSNGVVGDNNIVLISSLYMNDRPETKAFKENISSTIETLLNTQLSALKNDYKRNITTTTGNDSKIFYQAGRKTSDFIKYLSDRSYTTTNTKNSNFTTFFNLQNEFYFQSFFDLFNQTPVMEITTEEGETASIDSNYIREVHLHNVGLPISFKTYNQNFHKLRSDGMFEESDKTIKDLSFAINQGDCKIILQDQVNTTTNIKNNGLYENVKDIELFNSKEQLNLFNNNLFYQIKVTMRFDRSFVSGKVLKINNKRDNTLPVSFLSGNWLIVESSHLYILDGSCYSTLTLVKPNVKITDKYFNFKNVLV